MSAKVPLSKTADAYKAEKRSYTASHDLWPLCEPFQKLDEPVKPPLGARHKVERRMSLLPCSLLLSPLCDVCPPLDGPGVPPERVDAVSS